MRQLLFLCVFFIAILQKSYGQGTLGFTITGTNTVQVTATPPLPPQIDPSVFWQQVGQSVQFFIVPGNVFVNVIPSGITNPTTGSVTFTFGGVNFNNPNNTFNVGSTTFTNQSIITFEAGCGCGGGYSTSNPLPLVVKTWDLTASQNRVERSNGWTLKPKISLRLEISSQFTVEKIEFLKSSDGLENFGKIAEFRINDSTAYNSYVYDDENPKNGINYYTWKSIDNDGNEVWGDIKSIDASFDSEEPTFQNGRIEFDRNFQVIDINGRVLFSTYSLDVLNSNLPAIYLISWDSGVNLNGVPR